MPQFTIENKVFTSKIRPEKHINYIKCVPEYAPEKAPVVINILGAGVRGEDLSLIDLTTCPVWEIERGKHLPYIFFDLQCTADTWFEIFDCLIEFVEAIKASPETDENKIILTGNSMGAYCAWQLAMTKPEWFSCLVPLCGGGMYWNAIRFKDLPVWAFHGEDDDVVFPEESRKMVDKINECGGNAKLTILPGIGHNAWDEAYSSDEIWQWISDQINR